MHGIFFGLKVNLLQNPPRPVDLQCPFVHSFLLHNVLCTTIHQQARQRLPIHTELCLKHSLCHRKPSFWNHWFSADTIFVFFIFFWPFYPLVPWGGCFEDIRACCCCSSRFPCEASKHDGYSPESYAKIDGQRSMERQVCLHPQSACGMLLGCATTPNDPGLLVERTWQKRATRDVMDSSHRGQKFSCPRRVFTPPLTGQRFVSATSSKLGCWTPSEGSGA